MNATTDLERTLATWLEREGPDDVPERVVEAALAEAQTVRQRPAWLTSTWWASRASREGEAMKPTQTIERVPTLPVIRPPLRLGWVAVAILATLALLGGLLVAGALRNAPAPLLSECPAGTTPNEPGPVDQARPAPVWAVQSAAGDGKGSIYVASTDGTWRFDVCSNTWQRVANDATPGFTVWSRQSTGLVYDVDSDALLALAWGVRSFDPTAGEWTPWLRDEDTPTGYGAVYDRLTGLVVVLDGRTMWTYDVDTGAWREIDQGTLVPPDLRYDGIALVAYDTSADRIVLYRRLRQHLVEDWGPSTWTFDLRARSWTRSDSETPSFFPWPFGKQIVYDESTRRTVIFGDTTIAAFDAAADEWEIVDAEGAGQEVGCCGGRAAAYDPLNHRIVVFGGGWASAAGPVDDVIALDLRTRTWIELLAPSE